MKKIYTILIIAFANLSFSQDSRLFENTWYLRNVIVNGINNIPPNGNMNISFTATHFGTYCCNTMTGLITFANNSTSFSATNYNYSLDICNNVQAGNYQNIYFPFFDNGNNSNYNAVYNFTYNISELQGVRTLIINSMFNQQAVYSSVRLSSDNFKKMNLSISPNPSYDYVEINGQNRFTENTIVEFYNGMGQNCKTVNLNTEKTKIDLSNLPSGVYVLKIRTLNEIITQKLVKI